MRFSTKLTVWLGIFSILGFTFYQLEIKSRREMLAKEGRPTQQVLLCYGSKSYTYHKDGYCEGLAKCRGGSGWRTKQAAILDESREPCGYCYPKTHRQYDVIDDNGYDDE